MRISKRTLVVVAAVGAAAISMALAVGASGSGSSSTGGGSLLLEQSLAPSQPGDPVFHGVSPGGAPWVLNRGEVRLTGERDLDLRVEGLVIPKPAGNGTAGGVTTISASLYCGADSVTQAADTTSQVPISQTGDARIRDRAFDVPPTCLAPMIQIHPNGNNAVYIAVDGWRP
jgi:hypothetical protein